MSQNNLLVHTCVGGEILVDVYLLHLFPLSYVVEVNPAVVATGTQQQVVDLRKCDSGARPAPMASKYELFECFTDPSLILSICENTIDVPDHNLSIFVS